jgi:hypothetical protein
METSSAQPATFTFDGRVWQAMGVEARATGAIYSGAVCVTAAASCLGAGAQV